MGAVPNQERTDDMICGNFNPTDCGYTGEIRFFGTREKVELRRIDGKDNEKAPDFRIVAADNERIEYGAAWQKTSKEGRDYISLKLNLVVAPPVYLRLFETEVAGEYELVSN